MSEPQPNRPLTDADARLLARIRGQCLPEGDCQLWQGCTTRTGAPAVNAWRTYTTVRRVLWMLLRGPIPDGYLVVAACRQTACVAEDCLRCLPRRTVSRIDAARGVYSRADANAGRTLAGQCRRIYTDEQVRQVCEHPGSSYEAAAAVGVSPSHAKRLRNGTSRRVSSRNNPWAGLMP